MSASSTIRHLPLGQGVLLKNDEQAKVNRERFHSLGLITINFLSSPGAGKTALLVRSLSDLGEKHPCAVIVGDLATENDAQRLRRPGVEVVQITTGNVCHLEANMITRASEQLSLTGRHYLFLENVGNLVCPASFDLGEDLRVVLFSVTEGEDKPLKYPKIFKSADLILITKIDLAVATDFDREQALHSLTTIAPQARILEVSSRTGQGMNEWYAWLEEQRSHAER